MRSGINRESGNRLGRGMIRGVRSPLSKTTRRSLPTANSAPGDAVTANAPGKVTERLFFWVPGSTTTSASESMRPTREPETAINADGWLCGSGLSVRRRKSATALSASAVSTGFGGGAAGGCEARGGGAPAPVDSALSGSNAIPSPMPAKTTPSTNKRSPVARRITRVHCRTTRPLAESRILIGSAKLGPNFPQPEHVAQPHRVARHPTGMEQLVERTCSARGRKAAGVAKCPQGQRTARGEHFEKPLFVWRYLLGGLLPRSCRPTFFSPTVGRRVPSHRLTVARRVSGRASLVGHLDAERSGAPKNGGVVVSERAPSDSSQGLRIRQVLTACCSHHSHCLLDQRPNVSREAETHPPSVVANAHRLGMLGRWFTSTRR